MQCTLLNVATVKDESFNQITFLYCCLSNLLDRFTLATKSIFLVAFYFYNKGTKFSVVLAISSLVVRRTFYLIVNDRDLALNIRLLFSIVIQLLVVDYIIQPLVVNVNGFLQNFKIFF